MILIIHAYTKPWSKRYKDRK